MQIMRLRNTTHGPMRHGPILGDHASLHTLLTPARGLHAVGKLEAHGMTAAEWLGKVEGRLA